MKWLIGLLTAATGILHLLVGFNLIGSGVDTNWLLVLNGVGYLVLLWLFWTSNGSRRGTIRWILLAYTLITLVGYFLLPSGGFQNTIGLIIKAIELLLIILLFLDRGSDRVAVVPATTATPARSSAVGTGAVVSSEAYQAASGYGTASSAAAIGAVSAVQRAEAEADAAIEQGAVDTSAWGERTAADVDLGLGRATTAVDMDIEEADYAIEEIVEEGDEVVEETGEGVGGWLDRAGDQVGDAVDDTGDALAGAGAAVGAAVGGAVAWLGDKAEDAGDWVGDKVDDLGDTADAAVDTTGAAVGAGAGAAAGASAEWVGDTGDTYVGAERSVAAGGAAEWVGDTPDVTGELAAEADVAAGGAAEWVGDATDTASVAAGGAAEWVGETSDTTGEPAVRVEPTAAQLRSELEEYLRSFGSGSEFRKEIEYIEGIGPAYGAKLRAVGIVTVLDLMVEGATRIGRKHIADRSGLTASQILTWVNHIDLFRIKGVAQEYADLLEQSGVDTVVELAQRNPNNLFKRMNEINQQKALVRRTPHLSDVQSWVEQAKNLKRLIHY